MFANLAIALVFDSDFIASFISLCRLKLFSLKLLNDKESKISELFFSMFEFKFFPRKFSRLFNVFYFDSWDFENFNIFLAFSSFCRIFFFKNFHFYSKKINKNKINFLKLNE